MVCSRCSSETNVTRGADGRRLCAVCGAGRLGESWTRDVVAPEPAPVGSPPSPPAPAAASPAPAPPHVDEAPAGVAAAMAVYIDHACDLVDKVISQLRAAGADPAKYTRDNLTAELHEMRGWLPPNAVQYIEYIGDALARLADCARALDAARGETI